MAGYFALIQPKCTHRSEFITIDSWSRLVLNDNGNTIGELNVPGAIHLNCLRIIRFISCNRQYYSSFSCCFHNWVGDH